MFLPSSRIFQRSLVSSRTLPLIVAAVFVPRVSAFVAPSFSVETRSATSFATATSQMKLNSPFQEFPMSSRFETTRRFSSSSDDDQRPTLTNVDKMQMQEILSHVENETGDKSYVVIDVRGEDEINYTGKIHPMVHTLPLPFIAMEGAFNRSDEEFEEAFGFSKPKQTDTLVFSCKAGIRSQQAAQFAAMSGYKDMVNYMGGADEWFQDGPGW